MDSYNPYPFVFALFTQYDKGLFCALIAFQHHST